MTAPKTKRDLYRKALNAAERTLAIAEKHGLGRQARIVTHAMRQCVEHENERYLYALQRMKRTPVTIDEFMASGDFLGGDTNEPLIKIWPALQDDLRAINPDVLRGEQPIYEAYLAGATNTGKTVVGNVTVMYQAYCLDCFSKPQLLYGLSPATQIMFLLQSTSKRVTMMAIFNPLRTVMLAMPYVRRYMPHNTRKEGELEFTENHIHIAPALARLEATIGQAVAGGQTDEINFMSIVERSKMVAGAEGQGGRWDQAQEIYDTLSLRRKGRFATKGPSFGTLVFSSSTRYENDFLDRRIDHARKNDETNIVMRRHKQYDVAPPDKYSGERFAVLVGSNDNATRILKDEECRGVDFPENAQVEMVPVEFKSNFQKDPERALRDVIGIASKAIKPFITQRNKIVDAILEGREMGVTPFVIKQDVDLIHDGMPQVDETRLPDDLDTPRAVHIDLSKTGDRCGIAVVKIAGFVNVLIEDPETGREMVQTLPKYVVEAAISIQPHPMRPLDISDVRKWVIGLSTFYGFNIAHVSYDGFQSAESIELLRKAGVRAQVISVDTTTEPYEYLRRTLYEDRIAIADDGEGNEILRQELISLEYANNMEKVDHPPAGSKDVADAVCGAVYVLSRLRLTRSEVETKSTTGARIRIKRRKSGGTRPHGQRPPGTGKTRPRGRTTEVLTT